MTDPLTLRLQRRRFLTAAAAMGAGLAFGGVSGTQARAAQAIEVLTHDEVQEAAAFNRGVTISIVSAMTSDRGTAPSFSFGLRAKLRK